VSQAGSVSVTGGENANGDGERLSSKESSMELSVEWKFVVWCPSQGVYVDVSTLRSPSRGVQVGIICGLLCFLSLLE
jgi:hypothetical protein